LRKANRWIADQLLQNPNPTKDDLRELKHKASRIFSLDNFPGNAEILKTLENNEREKLLSILRRKKTRSLSGVNVIAVMTEPYPCPHGRCAYCPGGPEENSPQSYTGHEPAAMRGNQNHFHPYLQVKNRIEQLEAIGHEVDKVELIIMGGTFPATPRRYQEWFIKNCLDALTSKTSSDLKQAKVMAEHSQIRNVGLTVETRPDYCGPLNIDELLELGVTRVEMGVQTIFDDIYIKVDRGHKVEDVIKATQIMKDSALKIVYHMMPGLPGSTFDRDIDAFKTIFTDPRYKPDMIKIYPTLVVKGTRLYEWWRAGEFTPLTTKDAIELVAKIKSMVPRWVRIMRVQRDIPSQFIEAGVDKGNLRQLAQTRMEENGERCRCIRCREVGHVMMRGLEPDPSRIEIMRASYEASEGIEEFISAEDPVTDALIGFVRLRIPSPEFHRPEIIQSAGLIRELHVYGNMVPVGKNIIDNWQHRGWGESLMGEAERVAKEQYDLDKMIVMSALGTKEYYQTLGYNKEKIYVSKELK
jgi:elongator complex protein 3